MGGSFSTLGGQSRPAFGRIYADGSLDTEFNPTASVYQMTAVIAQPDGKILIGGNFTALWGEPRRGIGRLNSDGSLDTNFYAATNYGTLPGCFALQTDGKILVGGSFTTLGGLARTNLARLNSNGTADTGFTSSANGSASVLMQPDGRILVAGGFTALAGQPRNNVGRLSSAGSATQSLTHAGSTLTWLRGGASPEVWRTTFEISTNGTTWASLGAGTRIAGGWQLTGVSLPLNATVRARGYISAAEQVAGWFVETQLTYAPVILAQPLSRTNAAGTTASFAISATATDIGPLSYQWRLGGTSLLNDGRVSGATTPNLVLASVQPADAGDYTVVVTNLYGSVTSSAAGLTVMSPGRFTSFGYSPGLGSMLIFQDATVGWPYRIQVSTSLAQGSWTDWLWFTYNGPIGLIDPAAQEVSPRFYRVVSP